MSRLKQQPVVSAALVILNAGIFLICMFGNSSLYVMGRLSVESILIKRDYWRIVTAMFLHSGTNHLFSNMIILFFVGAIIEKEIGHIKFALLYLLSGICGNLLSLLSKVMTVDSYSIGASGAVFGLDGALLAMVLFWDRKLLQVTPVRVVAMIFLSIYGGFASENIDNAAHVGGLAAGFLLGCIFCLLERIKNKFRRSKRLSEEVTN